MKTEKSQTWIHFIGKNYYTMNKFVKEANLINVSRAISPFVIKKMNIGDVVLLAQKDGSSSKIFGYFVFTEITGLTPEAIETLQKEKIINKVPSITPVKIERGCGSYTVTGEYEICSANDLMNTLRDLDNDLIGRVMIGGQFHILKDIGIPVDYILTEIPFRKGFRLFDFGTFKARIQEKLETLKEGHHIKLKGQFYSQGNNFNMVPVSHSKLLEIRNYQLN